jgi:hypothetical protein
MEMCEKLRLRSLYLAGTRRLRMMFASLLANNSRCNTRTKLGRRADNFHKVHLLKIVIADKDCVYFVTTFRTHFPFEEISAFRPTPTDTPSQPFPTADAPVTILESFFERSNAA